MKKHSILVAGLAVGLGICAVAWAQSRTDSLGTLDQAVGLLKDNRPKEAREVLATIPKDDPAHATARGYDALCLYQLNKAKFLDTLESGEIQSAEIPSELREELDYEQIDALLFYRKFEQLLPKVREYTARHGNSPRLEAITEYQMAGLFERGMKQLRDATFTQRGTNSNEVASTTQRLQGGQENLEHFLKLATQGDRNGYQTLTNRDLATEVVKAMAALGGEEEALKLVPSAEREEMALALIQLHKKNDTDAAANLRRMTNFLNQFPNSKHGNRVRYDMGEVAINEGWRLTWEGKRAEAAPYLEKARGLFAGVVEDQPAGVSVADVMESRTELLRVFYAQNDWSGLSNQVAQVLANASAGNRDWLAAKLFDAVGLANQHKLTESAKELDELLATEFKGIPTSDGLLISAAEWRVYVARQTGDTATARQVAQMVQNSNCYGSLKRAFVKKYGNLLTQPNPTSK